MSIAEKIQVLRKREGLSQEELAERLNVSRQSVSKWETGAALPDTDKVIAICRLFGVSADALLNNGPLDDDGSGDGAAEEYDSACTEKRQDPAAEGNEPTERETAAPEEKKKSSGKKTVAVVCLIAAAVSAVIAVFLIFILPKLARPAGTEVYPYVLVHGMGGWGSGSGTDSLAHYWGADAGDIAEHLRSEGYEVYTPGVGPFSSAWDRACELYAQLTGGTVDYGAAHSAAHGHERYGRTYARALLPEWTGRRKVNLIGHSFGGETVRLLCSLLAYGDEAERAAGGDVSPLFTGGKGDYVFSVTTLCSPHNGSSLTCVLDSAGGLIGIDGATELAATLCFATAGLANPATGVYDFMLDQFGITDVSGGYTGVLNAVSAVMNSGSDHAAYDLSPDGAAELNKKIRLVDGVYYFSYAYSSTHPGKVLNVQIPDAGTLPVLMPFAAAIGSYSGTTRGGIVIDESWHENDGLVSVASAGYPEGDPYVGLSPDAEPLRGVWNVAPVRRGHHGTVIGLAAGTEETFAFYDELFAMTDRLRAEEEETGFFDIFK